MRRLLALAVTAACGAFLAGSSVGAERPDVRGFSPYKTLREAVRLARSKCRTRVESNARTGQRNYHTYLKCGRDVGFIRVYFDRRRRPPVLDKVVIDLRYTKAAMLASLTRKFGRGNPYNKGGVCFRRCEFSVVGTAKGSLVTIAFPGGSSYQRLNGELRQYRTLRRKPKL